MRHESFTPIAVITGLRRNRINSVRQGERVVRVPYPRRSEVIVGRNEFGDTVYINPHKLKGKIFSSDHIKLDPGTHTYLNTPYQSRRFETVKKKRTTVPGFSVVDGYRVRGGDFNRRPEKIGFGSNHEKRAVMRIRRTKVQERALRAAGINPHKLRLIMDYERIQQWQASKPTKPHFVERQIKAKGGNLKYKIPLRGISPQERAEMEKQKKRNNIANKGIIFRRDQY